MNKFSSKILLGSLLVALPGMVLGDLYRVNKGDTISTIAKKFYYRPLYGKNSAVSQIRKSNPMIRRDLIFPGQLIVIPFALRGPAVSGPEKKDVPVVSSSQDTLVSERESSPPLAVSEPKTEVFLDDLLTLNLKSFSSTVSGVEKANKSKGILESSNAYSVQAIWKVNWTSSFYSLLSLQLSSLDFKKAVSKNIQQKSKKFFERFAGIGVDVGGRTYVELKAGSSDEVFYQSVSPTTVAVDRTSVHFYSLGLTKEFRPNEKTIVGASLDYRRLMGKETQDFKFKEGFSYKVEAYFDKQIKDSPLSLGGSVFVKKTSQDTNYLEFDREDRGIGINVKWVY